MKALTPLQISVSTLFPNDSPTLPGKSLKPKPLTLPLTLPVNMNIHTYVDMLLAYRYLFKAHMEGGLRCRGSGVYLVGLWGYQGVRKLTHK